MEDFNPSEEEPKAEVKQEDDDETDLVGPLFSCMLLLYNNGNCDFVVALNVMQFCNKQGKNPLPCINFTGYSFPIQVDTDEIKNILEAWDLLGYLA